MHLSRAQGPVASYNISLLFFFPSFPRPASTGCCTTQTSTHTHTHSSEIHERNTHTHTMATKDQGKGRRRRLLGFVDKDLLLVRARVNLAGRQSEIITIESISRELLLTPLPFYLFYLFFFYYPSPFFGRPLPLKKKKMEKKEFLIDQTFYVISNRFINSNGEEFTKKKKKGGGKRMTQRSIQVIIIGYKRI